AFGAEAHGRLHGPLHRTAERDTPLELLGNRLRHQRGVDLGLAHLDDVEMRFSLGQLGQLAPQALDVGALLADDQTRTRGVNGHPALLVRTLDHDARNGSLLELLAQLFTDLQVLVQEPAIFGARGEPARIPGPVDAEAQADRIDFLAHQADSPCSATSRTT